jgi:opacity protein-like surface antigen
MRQLSLLAILLQPVLAQAQVVTIGAHGGVNVASADSGASTVKPVAGASLDVTLVGELAFRVEAEYSETGVHLDAASGSATMATDYSMGYLALPLNLRYDISRRTVPMYLFAGTTLGALLFATQSQGTTSTDVKSQLRPIDVTVDLGGGIGYQISPNVTVLCDVRFSFGLLDDVKQDAALALDSWQQRAVKVVFGVTYTLNPLTPSAPTMPGMPFAMPAAGD